MAQSQPHAPAVIVPTGTDKQGHRAYVHFTFQQLDRASDRVAHALAREGIKCGTRAALMVPPSLDFFALTFGFFKAGVVPVLIDPGMGLKNLKKCLCEAKPEAFIGIAKAHVARFVLGWPSVQTAICVGRKVPLAGPLLADLVAALPSDIAPILTNTRAEDMAAILFTSGSTGVPKGAVYNHGNFAAQVEALKTVFGIEPGEMDLATFPLFALFGPALGMTAVVPDMDPTRPAQADPIKIIGAIEDFGITNMFGSPALLNRVGRYGAARGIKLPSLRRVISAGAPVQAPIMARFASMLHAPAQIFTPYGATESLPVCTIGSDEILRETALATDRGKGVCVGKPVPGIRVEIIGIDDGPIPHWDDGLCVPDGTIGEIVVQGPQVTRAYYNRQASTDLAKIAEPDKGLFHRMGDLGYRDNSGRIWFCGRKTHRVQTAAETMFTIPCEGVFNAHPAVYRSALVGVPGEGGGLEPVMCIEWETDREGLTGNETIWLEELRQRAKAFEHTNRIYQFLVHPGFPVDIRHNAKIFREKLAPWAKKQLGR